MEQQKQERILIAIALVLFSMVVGYNAFFVPKNHVINVVCSESTSQSTSSIETNNTTDKIANINTPKSSKKSYKTLTDSKHYNTRPKTTQSGTRRIIGKININTATASQLADNLKGIGPKISQRIIEYRKQNGYFSSIEEIMRVRGIGEKIFAKICNNICV